MIRKIVIFLLVISVLAAIELVFNNIFGYKNLPFTQRIFVLVEGGLVYLTADYLFLKK